MDALNITNKGNNNATYMTMNAKPVNFMFDDLLSDCMIAKSLLVGKCPNCGKKKVKQVLLGTPATVDPMPRLVCGLQTMHIRKLLQKLMRQHPGVLA